jgi:uncharacterized RDD family membrane protein YckC
VSVEQIGPVYVPQSAQPSDLVPAMPELHAVSARPTYAGFWLRVVAYFIDTLLMSPIVGIAMSLHPSAFIKNFDAALATPGELPQPTPLAFALVIFVGFFYYTLFEASSWQATPGKRFLRLYVTDLSGRRLTLSRAAARNFPKMIFSSAFPVAHLLAGFTEKKQAVHDFFAGSLVLRRR